MRVALALLLAAVVLSPLTANGIDVWGDQSGTWTKENSPYNVVGEIRVPPGETLIIESGVVVNFQGHYKFIVDNSATVLAQGTESDSIIFVTDDPQTGWHGIRFLSASSNSQISYCRIEHGYATGPGRDEYGGGIYCEDSDIIVENCLFIHNSTDYAGAAMCCYGSSPHLTNTVFRENVSYNDGGAIHCTDRARPHFVGCEFTDNSATASGGAFSCYSHSEPNLINCTIAYNSAGGAGGGIQLALADAILVNCIVWGNSAPSGPQIWVQPGSASVSYSDIEGGWPGEGNIDADPLFVNPGAGDFHLQPNSPCIDTGDPEEGDRDHSRSDMGALPYFFEVAVRINPNDPFPITVPPGYDAYGVRTIANNTPTTQPFKRVTVITDSFGDTVQHVSSWEGELPREFLRESHGYFHVANFASDGFYNYVLVASNLETREIWHTSVTPFEVSGGRIVTISGQGWFSKFGDEFSSDEDVSLTSSEITFGSRCYPNPFNTSTTINYQLPVTNHLKLEIYNLLGQKVATLVDSKQQAGYTSVVWDASEVSSGLYFYKLTTGDFTETRRMMLVK